MYDLMSIEKILYELKDQADIIKYIQCRIEEEYETIPIIQASRMEFSSSRSPDQMSSPEAYVLALEDINENTYIKFLKDKMNELNQTKEQIEQALKTLTEKEREFITWYYFNGSQNPHEKEHSNNELKDKNSPRTHILLKLVEFMNNINKVI